jgi:dTMP kinase
MGGRLITIEGLDGAGKTTLASALAAALADRGVDVEVLREPGGVELSERIRTLVKDPALRVDPRAEALL